MVYLPLIRARWFGFCRLDGMKKIFLLVLIIGIVAVSESVRAQSALYYTGKRIHLSSVKLLSETANYLKLSVVVSNTGREDLRLYPDLDIGKVVITFGDSFSNSHVAPYKWQIVKAVIGSKKQLRAGEVLTLTKLKIRKDPNDLPRSTLSEKIGTTEENRSAGDAANPKLPGTTGAPNPSSPKAMKTSTVHHEGDDTKAETPAASPSKILSPIGVLPRKEKAPGCVDLMIDNIEVVKRTKRRVYLDVTLHNYGTGTFVYDPKSERYENLAIKAYLGAVPRLTRGALVTGGQHFNEIFRKPFTLGPGETIHGTTKVSLELFTKFTPVVILELDPFLALPECDKSNNVGTVILK